MLLTTCKNSFKCDLAKAFGKRIPLGTPVTPDTMRTLMFGNFMEPDAEHKIYDELDDWPKMEKIINYYANEYNATAVVPLHLQLFKYSTEHICRVARAFHMKPRGHLIAIGSGGCGRKTSITLAACMLGARLFAIQCDAHYTFADWLMDLKSALFSAGIDGKATILMYSDASHRHANEHMDTIVTIMDNGDLPNLYQSDDKARIMDAMQAVAKTIENNIDTTPAALYRLFVDRIRANLRIALVVSTLNDNLQRYLYRYPTLWNSCSFDYFGPWPDDALISIAERFVGSMSLAHPMLTKQPSVENSGTADEIEPTVKTIRLGKFEMSLTKLMVYFNRTVDAARKQLLRHCQRFTYTTPSTFLEMLNLFKVVYQRKHMEISQKRERYTTGLEKLASAAQQVGDMQKKLFDLQPKLKQLSDETEQIMVTIERDTAEAEKKKEVVGADEATANDAAATAQAIKDDCDSDLQVRETGSFFSRFFRDFSRQLSEYNFFVFLFKKNCSSLMRNFPMTFFFEL